MWSWCDYTQTPRVPIDDVLLKTTKPQTKSSAGHPVFKTQKMLGGRSLVTDSFSGLAIQPDFSGVHPGMAQYAHREGYNVLYGDWHAKWYGDPQQRIMWWDEALDSSWNTGLPCRQYLSIHLNHISLFDQIPNVASSWTGGGEQQPLSDGVWHIFDVSADIDVDALN